MSIRFMNEDNYIIINTEILKHLSDLATKNGFNRQISPEFFDSVDPLGKHLVRFYLDHYHKNGVVCEPHKRVFFLIKMGGSNSPELMALDISLDDFNWLEEEFTFSNKKTKLKVFEGGVRD